MNRFVEILNRIRRHANVDWLTPSQRIAVELLRERLEFLDELNLWGAHGVGKPSLAGCFTHSVWQCMPALGGCRARALSRVS